MPSEAEDPATARHRITHRTQYRYSDTVTSSYGRGFLTPRDLLRQRCVAHRLHIDPAPADSSTSLDGYGNICSRVLAPAGLRGRPVVCTGTLDRAIGYYVGLLDVVLRNRVKTVVIAPLIQSHS